MIIGLLGHAGAGKTTTAKLLVEVLGRKNTEILQVAAPIKAMLMAMGLQPEDFSHRTKEKTIGWIGASPRQLMQSLGDWGRGVNVNLWTDLLRERISSHLLKGVPHVVVDDIRMPSEAGLIRSMNGRLIRITRPSVIQGQHKTERMGDMIDVDLTLDNVGSLDLLKAALEDAIQETL